MKKFKRFLSVFLAVFMIISSIPASVYANEIIDEEVINKIIIETNDATSDSIVAEIRENRTENSKTYLMEDGTYCDIISANKIHTNDNNEMKSVTSELEQIPSTTDDAISLINSYSEESTMVNDSEHKLIKPISTDNLKFYKCNSKITDNNPEDQNDTAININGNAVFLMKTNLAETYSSQNKVINKVTIEFDVSNYKKKKDSRLYCYYGDNDWVYKDIENVENNSFIDYCPVTDKTNKVSFNITDIYSKWDRDTIDNEGVYFYNNVTTSYHLFNPSIVVKYTQYGYDDINQTYHNIDLGNAGQVLINDCTNTLTFKQNLAGIDLSLMGVELTKYLTSSNDTLNSTCGPNSTLNYNSFVKLYNNSLVWKMFDGSEKVFNRPVDSMSNENGFEEWEEIEETRTGIHTAKLNIDEDILENIGIFTDYSNMSIEYGNSKYTFDSNGFLLKISCSDTHIQLMFADGKIISITDGNGNKYSLVYNNFQYNNESYTYLKKINVRDKNNNYIKFDGQNSYIVNCSYVINEDGTVMYTTTYPNGDIFTVVYDSSFNILSVKNNDITTTFEYKEGQKYILGYTQTDKDNQVISKVSIDSSNTFERVYTYITEENKTEVLDFNKLGQLISSIDKNGNQVCFGYDDFGNLQSYALDESTPNLIPNGDFAIKGQWDPIVDACTINGVAKIPKSLTAGQGVWQDIENLSVDKTYVLSISGQCNKMISSDDAFLGVELIGYDEDENEITIKLPLINGNCPENQFETKKIAFKLEKSLSDVEVDVVSRMQANEAIIDYVSLQEAENSSVSIEVGTPISAVFNENGLIEREFIDDGTQKLITTYTYNSSNNISEITDNNGIKTYYTYENGKMVSKGNIKDGNTIINPIKFSYSSIGLLESVEQIIDTVSPNGNQFKTEYQYEYDQVAKVTRNGITYIFDYYPNGEIKSINLQNSSDESNITLIEKDHSDEIYSTVINYANGNLAKIKQDNDRISEITYTDSDDNTILKYIYSYDNDGNLQSIYDNDKIKTYFFDSGFSILYKNSNNSLENGNEFREIYKKSVDEDGQVTETYLSDMVDEEGNPTETNTTNPIVVTKEGNNTVYTQEISTKKSHSTFEEGISIDYSTHLKSVRDYFGRLTESDVNLNPSYTDTRENPTNISYNMNINSSYQYKGLSSDEENKEITTSLVSKRTDKYEFSIEDNKTTDEIIYSYEYYPNGKLKLVSLSYEENANDSNSNNSIVNEPICYYEYDANGNISFEFNLLNNICLKYRYNSYGNLSERINYNIDECSYEDCYYFLALKGVIESPLVDTTYPDLDIELILNIEKSTVTFNCDDNALKSVSSISFDGEECLYAENDELGQPIEFTDANHELIGRCEWTGNLLTAFETQDTRFEFTYDVNGYRTSKKVYTKKDEERQYNCTILYNWEDGLLQGIYLTNEENVPEIVIYTDIIYDINNSPVAIQTPSGLQYLFEKDANGNIVSLINGEGERICYYKYDAFGNVSLDIIAGNWGEGIVYSITAIFNPCTYKGALYDYEIGMYFIQGKCYSPFLGRYLNVSNYDSLNDVRDEANTNSYVFCGNDPINDSDAMLKVGPTTSSIVIYQNGFTTDMTQAFLSRAYCSTFTNSLIKRYGEIASTGKYQFLGMDKERIQSDLFAHSVGRYCEESINRVNSVWGDGWLFNNRNSSSIYVNNGDTNYKKYEEIWNSAEAIRKYAVNKGIYIGL